MGLGSGCTNPLLGVPHVITSLWPGSYVLEAQTSEHCSLGLGSEGFQVAQLGGTLLVKEVIRRTQLL